MIHTSSYVPLPVDTREQMITNTTAGICTVSYSSLMENGGGTQLFVCGSGHIMTRVATTPLKKDLDHTVMYINYWYNEMRLDISYSTILL